jgi:hypothetical protein
VSVIDVVEASCFTVPIDAPESDGTMEWDATTVVVVVEARSGTTTGLGGLDLSDHCARQLAAHALCGVDRLRQLEYFYDHVRVRVEGLLFDGVLEPVDGAHVPDRSRPGDGLELKRADALRWAA